MQSAAAAMTCSGIGLRHAHHAQVLRERPPLSFVEVHSENFYGDGGAALATLHAVRAVYPISLHGVGLSLGSACGVDEQHLNRLARLVERIDPVRVSDHLCFARAPLDAHAADIHAADLLPVAFTAASLQILADNIDHVQQRLRRPILVENLSAYFGWADDAIAEPQFISELARRTGCSLLLDVNNLVVNALNAGTEPVSAVRAWVDAIDPENVGEIHLAGHCDLRAAGGLVIDDHGSRVAPVVWQAYAHTLGRLGPVPILIEWDTDLPPLQTLLDEAAQADALLTDCPAVHAA